MGKWDWVHAGLELATFTQAQRAREDLSAVRSQNAIEAAHRIVVEAMRAFLFDISRDIQLAEDHIDAYPQQVYIVARALEDRLGESGVSADDFADLPDKEYLFKTQRKLREVADRTQKLLSGEQREESETAVRYISEIPLLARAHSAKVAAEALADSEEEWRKLSGRNTTRKVLLWLGIGALVFICGAIPLFWFLPLVMLTSGEIATTMAGGVLAAAGCLFVAGSIVLIVLGARSIPGFKELKAQRESLRKELMPVGDWGRVVSTFGNLSSSLLQDTYEERVAYVTPLLGGDFQASLTSGTGNQVKSPA